jgi:hypothetical protein
MSASMSPSRSKEIVAPPYDQVGARFFRHFGAWSKKLG